MLGAVYVLLIRMNYLSFLISAWRAASVLHLKVREWPEMRATALYLAERASSSLRCMIDFTAAVLDLGLVVAK